MKKVITLSIVLLTSLLAVSPAFAQTQQPAEFPKYNLLFKALFRVMITLAGASVCWIFHLGRIWIYHKFGNPEKLDQSKKTVLYSAIGLAIVLGAFVLSSIVTQLATAAFGAGH